MSGDYIVRHSPTRNLYVLTCNWEGHGRHFMFHQQTNVSETLVLVKI